MSERCKKEKYNGYRMAQCKRSAWKDGYCQQHHPDTVRERNEKKDARWKAEEAERKAHDPKLKIAALTSECESLRAQLAEASKLIEELKKETVAHFISTAFFREGGGG